MTDNPAEPWVRQRERARHYNYAERRYSELREQYLTACAQLAQMPPELVAEAEAAWARSRL